jgi:hypothetical protein
MNHKIEDNEAIPNDQILENFLESNMERLEKINNYMEISTFIGYITFMTFLIILIFKINFNFSIFYLLVPAIISTISTAIYLNLFLKFKDIYDEYEKNEKGLNIGSIISYFTLNCVTVLLIIYLILSSLKLSQIILSDWSMITLPVYFMLGVLGFYLIFITPAFITNKYYFEMIIIYVYLICSFCFFSFIPLKLEKQLDIIYCFIFIPVVICISCHLIYLLRKLFKIVSTVNILNVISISLVLGASVLIPLNLDKVINIQYWIPILICFVSFVICIYENITGLFIKDEDDSIK